MSHPTATKTKRRAGGAVHAGLTGLMLACSSAHAAPGEIMQGPLVEAGRHLPARSQSLMLHGYAQQLNLANHAAPSRPHPVTTIGLTVAGLSGLAMAHTKGRHDKIDHIIAGYLVGLATSGIYTLYTKEPDSRRSRAIAFLLGVAASAAVGALKEEYDGRSGTGQVDDMDIYATIGGGVGGAFTIGLIDWLFL